MVTGPQTNGAFAVIYWGGAFGFALAAQSHISYAV